MTKSRIFIVEDEAIVVRDIRLQLQELGYEPVGETASAEEAIELVGQLRPDLVLMDIHLAGKMDGIAAAQAIYERHSIPVVFLTAFTSDLVIDRAKLAEPFGYIIKPFDERELRSVIEISIYRHQMETRQREAAEEQAAIVHTALDGYWVVDMAGRILEVNDAACALYGYSREEMLGLALADFEVDETPAEISGQIDGLVGHAARRIERRHRRKNGKIANIEISMTYRPKSGGRMIAFLRDVTERRRAERLLQARVRLSEISAACSLEELLEKTLDEAEALTNSAIGVFRMVHADQKTILQQTWSANTRAQMGPAGSRGPFNAAARGGVWLDSFRERQPVICNDCGNRPPRQDLPAGCAAIVRELVVPIIRDGLVRAIIGVGNKPEDYDEEDVRTMLAIAEICWDMVGRKHAEQARHQSEANLEALLNAATESAFLMERDGTILTTNETLAQRLNMRPAEMLGACMYNLIPPELVASRRLEVEKVFVTGEAVRFTDQRAGRWLDQSLVPVRDARGRIDRIAVFATDITESRRAVAALKAEQERIQEIFRSAPVGIGTSVDRIFHYTNDVFCRITGYAREELIGQNARMLYPTEQEYQAVGEKIRSVLPQDGHGSVEAHWRRKDGTLIEVLLSGSVMGSETALASMVVAVLDITDRKRTDRALQKSESRLRQAQKILGLGVWDWDIATDRTVWSGEMFTIYGITEETFTGRGQDYIAFTHPEDRAIQAANIARSLAQAAASESPPAPEPKQFRIVRPDGTIRWIEGDAEVVLSPAREPITMVGTIIDITERKQAEEALRASEERFRLIFNLNGDASGVWEFKPDGTPGRFIEVNEVACERFGYTRAEFLQLSPRDLQSPESALVAAQKIGQLRLQEGVLTEMEHVTKTGRRFPVEVSARAFELNGRRLVMSAARDISARKALEAQYRQAQKMEVIGQLAGGVAHDFNNILTVMLLDLESLRLARLTPEVAAQIEELSAMAKRGARLTQQLLMFARQQPMRPAHFELNGALSALAKILRRLLGEHISLRFVVGAPDLWIHADASAIDQSVMNLCVNARDAMATGGTLTIATSVVEFDTRSVQAVAEARPGRFACLTVTDTGTGMNAEILQHIFEPFFTTKEVGRGTGLGLASVYGVVHQHQGWINVESKVGQGTTFLIYLPASQPNEPSRGGEISAQSLVGGGEIILLVEDDDSVRKMSTLALRKLGYQVLPTANAQEAQKVWRERSGRIDFLVTDMIMPGDMNGLQLSEALRRLKPGLKVLLVSGHSEEILKFESRMGAGMSYLHKPFELKDLAGAIRRSLDGGPDPAPRN